MVEPKAVSEAVDTAALHFSSLLNDLHNADPEGQTVYAQVFANTLQACGITEAIMRERYDAFAKEEFGETNAAKGLAGNMMKECTNPNMGQKVFLRCMRALFPQA